MRVPLFRAESIKRTQRQASIERYVENTGATTPYWRVIMQHIQIPTIQNTMEFETEAEAMRFKAGLTYDPAEILDLWNRNYPNMAFFPIGPYQPTVIWRDGIKYDAFDLTLVGSGASNSPAIRLKFPTEGFGLRRYGTGSGLRMVDIFGTVPGVPQPQPTDIEYPPPPLAPGLEDPQGPPATPDSRLLDKNPNIPKPGVLLPYSPDFPTPEEGATRGTFTGSELRQKGYVDMYPPKIDWRIGPSYVATNGYTWVIEAFSGAARNVTNQEAGLTKQISGSDFSGAYLTSAAQKRLGLTFMYNSPGGWYDGTYYDKNQYYNLVVHSRGLDFGEVAAITRSIIFQVASNNLEQSWYIVDGGAAGYYNPADRIANNKFYASGTFNAPRNGWFYGRYGRA